MNEDLTANKIVISGDDSIVVKKFIKGIEGGRTLKLDEWTEDVVKCGHVIVKTTEGDFIPAPVSGKAYQSLGTNVVVGVLYGNVVKPRQAASIMTWGIVNKELLPYPFTEEIAAALPHIGLESDNV